MFANDHQEERTAQEGLHTLLLHLQAVGDVLPHVRSVVSSTGTGACAHPSLASTAFGVSSSFLRASSQTPDSQVMVLRIPKLAARGWKSHSFH